MYNRYIRNDNGSYTRIPEEDVRPSRQPPPAGPPSEEPEIPKPPPFEEPEPQKQNDARQPPPRGPESRKYSGARTSDGLTSFLQNILNQLHLDHVDTGDLLLLILLFFLFREDADEELLVALGLLLIL